MRGRRRIYADKKERQRAYYARHREREQERSRARYLSLHPQAKSSKQAPAPETENEESIAEEETEEDKLYRQRCAILSRTTCDLGNAWEITPDTDLELLLYTLTADLRSWRKTTETDREEYEVITRHALDLKTNNEPLSALVEYIYERRLIYMAVADVAQRAEHQVRMHDPERMIERSQDWAAWHVHVSGLLREAFADLTRKATSVERNVREIVILYGVDDVLRTRFTSGSLHWQSG